MAEVEKPPPPPPPKPEPEPEPPPVEPPPPPPPEPEPPPPEPPPPAPVIVTVTEKRLELDKAVQFEAGSAQIGETARAILDEVVKTLNDHPEIRTIRVEGHDHKVGKRRKFIRKQLKISQRRAAVVKTYLIEHGVTQRLLTKGYGSAEPIGGNDSPEGRQQNRRVEFRILKRDASKEVPKEPPKDEKSPTEGKPKP